MVMHIGKADFSRSMEKSLPDQYKVKLVHDVSNMIFAHGPEKVIFEGWASLVQASPGWWAATGNPEIEASNYTELLKTKIEIINNIPSLDLCLLGIGGDGHTASIFPHELKKLSDKTDCVVGINPESEQKRVSLSIKQINNSKEVIFHVCGSGKKDVVDMIISKRDNYLDLPASHILPKSKNLSWYLDFDSAETFMGT